MKNILLAIIAVAAIAMSFTQYQENKGLARVEVMQGKEVYVMSEPLRDYTVVERINDFGLTTKGCKVQNLAESFMNKSHRKDIEFDALIIDGSSKAMLIKWK